MPEDSYGRFGPDAPDEAARDAVRPFPRNNADGAAAAPQSELAAALTTAQGAMARALRLVEAERLTWAETREEFEQRLGEAERSRREALRKVEVGELILRRTEERLMAAEREAAARADELIELQRRLANAEARAAEAELRTREAEDAHQRAAGEAEERARITIEAAKAEAEHHVETLLGSAAEEVKSQLAGAEQKVRDAEERAQRAEKTSADAEARLKAIADQFDQLESGKTTAEQAAAEIQASASALRQAEQLAEARAAAAEQAADAAAASLKALRGEIDRLQAESSERLDALKNENDKLRAWRLKAIERMQAAGLMKSPASAA
ncbi:MAG: hypothetical protein JNK11_15920 [Alphaproteobacteria bacterium]|nr:hypothetical protein [Alphaproteobacteria bacterium]